MNPMTNVKNVKKLSELELKRSLKTSWHDQYKDSAWIFVGGLPYDLTEGDIICVFSQYGEIVNLNLVRDKATGKSKGFCFLCYEDQRSTILAVDNLNGIKILGRTIRVDHVSDYKPPKISDKMDDETKKLNAEGCASVAAAPCHDLKEIKIIKKEKEDIEKPKKKKSKRKSKKKESSSSEDSNNSSDSESDDSKAGSAYHHTKKNKNSRKKEKKKSKKKKSRIAEVTSDSSTDNETIRDSREKRRKLVEKIKFLEAALSNSRKAAKRTDFSEEVESKLRSEDASKRAFGEHYSDSIKRNVQKENNKREKTYHNTEMLHNKNDEYISRRQMNDHDNVKKRNMCASSARDKSKDTLWSLERGQDRDSDWERTKEKDKYARDRTYDNRRSYERNYKHHRK